MRLWLYAAASTDTSDKAGSASAAIHALVHTDPFVILLFRMQPLTSLAAHQAPPAPSPASLHVIRLSPANLFHAVRLPPAPINDDELSLSHQGSSVLLRAHAQPRRRARGSERPSRRVLGAARAGLRLLLSHLQVFVPRAWAGAQPSSTRWRVGEWQHAPTCRCVHGAWDGAAADAPVARLPPPAQAGPAAARRPGGSASACAFGRARCLPIWASGCCPCGVLSRAASRRPIRGTGCVDGRTSRSPSCRAPICAIAASGSARRGRSPQRAGTGDPTRIAMGGGSGAVRGRSQHAGRRRRATSRLSSTSRWRGTRLPRCSAHPGQAARPLPPPHAVHAAHAAGGAGGGGVEAGALAAAGAILVRAPRAGAPARTFANQSRRTFIFSSSFSSSSSSSSFCSFFSGSSVSDSRGGRLYRGRGPVICGRSTAVLPSAPVLCGALDLWP